MHENSELTNHDCFANVFRERGFRKFSTAQIGKLLQEEYPNFSLGSILPNDHAKAAVSAFRIEAVPGGVESLAFDISTRQLTRMPARGRLTPAISLE